MLFDTLPYCPISMPTMWTKDTFDAEKDSSNENKY